MPSPPHRPRRAAMPNITVNEENRSFTAPLSVADLLRELGRDPRQVAVEVNLNVVRRDEHPRHQLSDGHRVEIVTLVGGGTSDPAPALDNQLKVGKFTFRSRLFTGT